MPAPGTEKLPRLEDAAFYGKGQEWGLALAEEVAKIRRGEISWADAPRSAMFYGPPGTGKTVLARMIGAACGLPVIEFSIADLFASGAGYLDSVIKALRAAFAKAAAAAPCILFWDEVDALPNRATMSPRGKDWWTPVINDLANSTSSLSHARYDPSSHGSNWGHLR